MKKIIAAAIATAFVAPVMAADVTVSGSQEFSYKSVNGTTTTETDGVVTFKASTETANGYSVTADINMDEIAGNEGGDSITVSGPFGTLDLGDTSSAADVFDDMTDVSKVAGTSLGAPDATIGWTLPTMVEGMTVYVSHAADAHGNSDATDPHTGYALKYATGPFSIAFGSNDNEDGTSQDYIGGSYSVAGLKLVAERFEDGTSGSTTEEQAVGITYTMDNVTFLMTNEETKGTDGAVDNDVTFYGVHVDLGGGVTAFVEASSDDLDETADTTAAGIAMSF